MQFLLCSKWEYSWQNDCGGGTGVRRRRRRRLKVSSFEKSRATVSHLGLNDDGQRTHLLLWFCESKSSVTLYRLY